MSVSEESSKMVTEIEMIKINRRMLFLQVYDCVVFFK